jgi:hypothetical protein
MNSVPGEVAPDWRKLWRLAERLSPGAGEDGDYSDDTSSGVFADVGLILMNPDKPVINGGYDTTPLGSVYVAGTGGDGVHFSLLPPDGSGVRPVVMTVPMMFDNPNVVVGGSLREFLALGCTVGYWGLEALAYDFYDKPPGRRNETGRRLQSAEPEGTEQDVALLRALTAEFDLRPWPDPVGRLAELERLHFDRIRLDSRRF